MTSRAGYFGEAQVPDIERRLASVLRVGVVEALDEAKARVRVKAGNVTTAWIPWTAMRAGPDRQWSAPEVGEQVIVAAPGGDLAQGVVIGSIYRDQHPAPADSKDTTRYTWSDGSSESYDRQGHAYSLNIPHDGSVTITVGGTTWVLRNNSAELTTDLLTINGNVRLNGRMDATVDVTAANVSLKNHTHGGVMRGGANTNPPNAG